jgi:hypothetical protein
MGTWGTSIKSNDLVQDIIDEFFYKYNHGEEINDIRKQLEESYSYTIEDESEGYLFWFGLAKAQWDIGHLDPDALEKVQDIYKSDIDTKSWEDLGGTKSDIKKRKLIVQEFVNKLQTVNPKPRSRKKIILRSSPYELGSVITFKFEDGYYGVFIVVTVDKDKEYCNTGGLILDIKQKNTPTMFEVIKSNVRINSYPFGDEPGDKIDIKYYAVGLKKVKDGFKLIGKVKVRNIMQHPKSYTAWFNLIPSLEIKTSNRKISTRRFLGYRFYEKIKIESEVS